VKSLALRNPLILAASFNRPNIAYSVHLLDAMAATAAAAASRRNCSEGGEGVRGFGAASNDVDEGAFRSLPGAPAPGGGADWQAHELLGRLLLRHLKLAPDASPPGSEPGSGGGGSSDGRGRQETGVESCAAPQGPEGEGEGALPACCKLKVGGVPRGWSST
jgi:hypothetical protein